jgi:hypothetical protein
MKIVIKITKEQKILDVLIFYLKEEQSGFRDHIIQQNYSTKF